MRKTRNAAVPVNSLTDAPTLETVSPAALRVLVGNPHKYRRVGIDDTRVLSLACQHLEVKHHRDAHLSTSITISDPETDSTLFCSSIAFLESTHRINNPTSNTASTRDKGRGNNHEMEQSKEVQKETQDKTGTHQQPNDICTLSHVEHTATINTVFRPAA